MLDKVSDQVKHRWCVSDIIPGNGYVTIAGTKIFFCYTMSDPDLFMAFNSDDYYVFYPLPSKRLGGATAEEWVAFLNQWKLELVYGDIKWKKKWEYVLDNAEIDLKAKKKVYPVVLS